MNSFDDKNPIHSLILQTATRYLVPLLLLFSIFLLTRGHNEPGGGFVGGLIAGAAFALHAIAHNVRNTRLVLRVSPRTLIGSGLLIALASGLFSLLQGKPFLTGVWSEIQVPIFGKLGTPALFDIGVFIAVLGVVLMIIFELMED